MTWPARIGPDLLGLWRLLGSTLLLGLGVYLAVTSLPTFRPKPSLREQLRWMDLEERARMASERHPGSRMFNSPYLESMFRPLFEELGEGLRRLRERLGLGGLADLERRLAVTGSGVTVGQFYGKKLLTAVILFSPWLGNFLGVRTGPLWLWLVVGVFGFVLPDHRLRAQVEQQRTETLLELEPLLDMLSIATAARLGLEEALIEVLSECDGSVSRELRRAVTDTRFGIPFSEALEEVAARHALPELTLFVRQLRSTAELGVPTARALASQAEAIREQRRVELLRHGGNATVKMVAPVALFILPVFVAVLLLPAIVQMLQLGR